MNTELWSVPFMDIDRGSVIGLGTFIFANRLQVLYSALR